MFTHHSLCNSLAHRVPSANHEIKGQSKAMFAITCIAPNRIYGTRELVEDGFTVLHNVGLAICSWDSGRGAGTLATLEVDRAGAKT